ncbi:protein of unknown function DUF4283 - like 10 [Theobroma cacao]|nr:protein of unknown function DUF4283 - like 10 [Theobroma cacao]
MVRQRFREGRELRLAIWEGNGMYIAGRRELVKEVNSVGKILSSKLMIKLLRANGLLDPLRRLCKMFNLNSVVGIFKAKCPIRDLLRGLMEQGIKPRLSKLVAYEKFVQLALSCWVKLEVVPLQVWHHDLFKPLGDKCGEFVKMDVDTMSMKRLDHVCC